MLAAENRREKQIPRPRPENGRARNDRFEAGREISKLSSRGSPPLADEPRDLQFADREQKQIPRSRPENGRARDDDFDVGREIGELSSRGSPPLGDEPRDLQFVIENKSRLLAAVHKTAGLGMTVILVGRRILEHEKSA